jgi:APA family basic amino acid/polyamine antiporter
MSQDAGSPQYHRSLRLIDGVLLVVGSMIGSGIFLVSADISRTVGSSGWMILVWVLTGLLTIAAATSYGELSGMYPKAGGQYVYLREAYGPMWGFLYGWAFFAVIQTGTIAAVGVAFAKFTGYLLPALGEDNIILNISGFTISAAQLTGIAMIILLTIINTGGIKSGKIVGAVFTSAKIVAMAALIIAGFVLVKDGGAIWNANWDAPWMARSIETKAGTIHHELLGGGTLVVAICVAMVGSIFSSDAWNGVTFIAGEIKRPERNIGLSLLIGTVVVTLLYIAMNLMYLNVLSIHDIAFAKQDRVAIAASLALFGDIGTMFIAVLVMVSTFGCNNGLILSGARVYSTMAKDGLFFPAAAKLNKNGVPAIALVMQAVWASVLCLSGKYGQLLDYIVIVALFFYVMTIGGIFVLRRRSPEHPRPYTAFGYPVVPVLYMVVATFIAVVLLKYKPATTWPGVIIVLLGWPIYKLLEARLKRIQAAGNGPSAE